MTNQIDKAPAGATHRYEHGGLISWYREDGDKLFVWQPADAPEPGAVWRADGIWCGVVFNTTAELMTCMPGRLTAIPAVPAQQADDDLTWLVRESRGEWFGSHPTHIARDGDLLTWATFPRLPDGYYWFTKAEYLARRAELQNKPGWKDAPEWARSLAQHSVGRWTWYEEDPSPNDNGFWVDGGVCQCAGEAGEVLGDWRDTLERRPADLSDPAVTKRLDEATQNVLAAVPGLMDEKFKFEHNTKPVAVSNETVQLEQPISATGTGNGSATESAFLIGRVIDLLRTSVDHFSADELAELNELTGAELTKRDAAVCGGQKYLDAHWFERGELPPVGATVMHMGTATDKDWLEVEIIAHAQRKGFKVAVFEYPGGVSFSSATYFRPVRTERDVLLSIIVEEMNRYDTDGKLADAILAAGFKRGGAA